MSNRRQIKTRCRVKGCGRRATRGNYCKQHVQTFAQPIRGWVNSPDRDAEKPDILDRALGIAPDGPEAA